MAKTFILQMEHPVPDYDTWKKAGFDSDPIGREQSGVKSYRISRPVDNQHYVLIDLEFDNLNQAEACLDSLNKLWQRVMDRFKWSEAPKTRIVELVDDKSY